jgi:hypothetical protein
MPEPPSPPPAPARAARAVAFALPAALILAGAGAGLGLALRFFSPPPTSVVTERPTPSLLRAIRDVARLETAEVHVEKVIDLTDTQSRFFGLIEAKDALLLVAVGHATVGVDLSKLREGDVSLDAATGVARIVLPPPEVVGTRLDEDATYVFTRDTDLLARRNEHLEASARREAVRAIEKAAAAPEVMDRARAQAERQLVALATGLGASRVEVSWRGDGGLRGP